VSSAKSAAKISLLIGGIGTVGVAALLAAAHLGIWMEGANLHPTPRINAFTVGLGIVPVPALAWIVYLWTRTRPGEILDIVVRIAASCAILLIAGYCLLGAFFAAFFVG
jgi:hypothetical protein